MYTKTLTNVNTYFIFLSIMVSCEFYEEEFFYYFFKIKSSHTKKTLTLNSHKIAKSYCKIFFAIRRKFSKYIFLRVEILKFAFFKLIQ